MIFNSVKYKISTLLAVLALGCAGCHNSDAPLPPGVEEPDAPDPDKLMLCLNVSFDGQYGATRADNDPDGYQDPSGDFEKISTLRVIILRDVSKDPETGVESGIVEANRLVMTNDAGRPMYDDLQFKVIANEWKRIYLIANEEYLPSSPQANTTATQFLDSFKTPRQGATGVVTDLTELTNWTVSVPNLTPSTTQIIGYPNGLFSPNRDKRLPLTESFDVYAERSDETDDIFYSNLFMTRAAAKAIFFLNTSDDFIVNEGEEIVNTKITAISLTGVGTTEYVFPYKTEYNPTKADLVKYSSTELPSSSLVKNAFITTFATPETNRNVTYLLDDINVEIVKPAGDEPVAITSPIYFPESILEAGEHYEVGVRLSDGRWLRASLDENSAYHNILSIKDGDSESEAIARNTYLPIELKFDGALQLEVNVLPWNRENYYVDYTANIGFNSGDYLSFNGTQGPNGDYLLLDQEAAQLVLNYGKVANGRFYIASPVGATWDAYLITTGGTTDAIQFQIPDPENSTRTITTTHLTGKVGKDEAKFGIVATVAPGDNQNSAQLMVIVTLENGTPVVADVIKGWGSNLDRLTIIENPK